MGEQERILFIRSPYYWGLGGLFPSFEIHSYELRTALSANNLPLNQERQL